jgi:hypothetical protein
MSLFDTYISCILSYGCETWGSQKGEDIEKVHLNFLKRTLKVRRSAVNVMVYWELGRVPMYVERYYRMLKGALSAKFVEKKLPIKTIRYH